MKTQIQKVEFKENDTWIVVANQTETYVFSRDAHSKKLELVETILNPEGRLKNQDVNTDRPGRSFSTVAEFRHAMPTEDYPKVKILERYARQIAQMLDERRHLNAFDHLVLVAEPNFLGVLEAELPTQTANCVRVTIKKEIQKPDMTHLKKILKENVAALI